MMRTDREARKPKSFELSASNQKRVSSGLQRQFRPAGTAAYMPKSNKFGSCASGSVVAPTMAANSFITLGLPPSLLRV